MRREMEAGRIWQRGIEWDAVRGLLAQQARTTVGRERGRRVVADLERLFQTSDNDRIFADRFVTVRHGRYVVPVRAEARQRLRGIVHDRSQSGQTLFVEPESAVDANNDLVQLTREEEQETARILGELSDAVRARLDDLDPLVGLIARLDALLP